MQDGLIERLRTVIAIPVTPFDVTGRLDEKAYVRIVRRVAAVGVTVFTPNGNTGEFYSLSRIEGERAVTATMEAVGDRGLVVPGVGGDLERAVGSAREAAACGAAAVMVHQPVHPYQSTRGWVAYHEAVAEAVPELGLVAYVRDPRISAEALAALADRCPTLVGVKYAVPDPLGLPDAVRAVGADRVAWICGLAERWAPFHWVGGARGLTSGLVNVAPELPLRLLDLLRRGDFTEAMALWATLSPLEEIRARRSNENNVAAVKEALAQLGLCDRAVRPPATELPDAERSEVTDILHTWGYKPAGDS